MTAPLAFEWTEDGTFRPLRRFAAQADHEFCVGERYVLDVVEESQKAIDRGYHARIREAWMQLPEGLAEQFPNPTDLRRHLLVACGFCTTKRLRMASAKEALAAVPIFAESGATVELDGAVIVIKTPMSQKLRGGMSRDDRLRSYRETEDLAATLIGTTSDDLRRHAEGMAA